jgi:outer membrane immunogenic protein
VALSSAAYAADMGMPLKAPPPAPPPVQDWSGVYVGIEGGYGWGKQNINGAPVDLFSASDFFEDPFFFCKYNDCVDPTVGSVSQSGWLFGGHAGVQKQWGSVVLGIDAGIDGADIKGTTTATTFVTDCSSDSDDSCHQLTKTATLTSKIDALGHVGPKIGWAFSPNWMVYATGGLAWAHVEGGASETQTFQKCEDGSCFQTTDDLNASFSGSQSGGMSMFGYAVGAGLDYKWQLDQGSAVILGVQYLHYGFGNNTLMLADTQFGTGSTFGIDTKQSVDTITGRLSYFFSIH